MVKMHLSEQGFRRKMRGYGKYLLTPRWRELRQQALERDGFRCRGCNSTERLDVHHRHYRIPLGSETVEDLTTLCGGPDGCHHAITSSIRARHRVEISEHLRIPDDPKARGTLQQAETLFRYDAETGRLHWRVSRSSRAKVGAIAGHRNLAGYWYVHFNTRTELQSHVIWLLHTGSWPPEEIGYRDKDHNNTKIENLKSMSHQEVGMSQSLSKINISGIKGVYQDRERGKWVARITVSRRCFNLGTFETKESAAAAYELARERMSKPLPDPTSTPDPRPGREEIAALLDYSPETGELKWRVDRSGECLAGSKAGSRRNQSSNVVVIAGKAYLVSHIAWLLHHGRWPLDKIRHHDGDKRNTCITNLYELSYETDLGDESGTPPVKPSKSGFRGVHAHYNRWVATGRGSKYLGTFDTAEAASSAVVAFNEGGFTACSGRREPAPFPLASNSTEEDAVTQAPLDEIPLYDSAEVINTPERAAAYLDAAMADGDPKFIEHARGVIARAGAAADPEPEGNA